GMARPLRACRNIRRRETEVRKYPSAGSRLTAAAHCSGHRHWCEFPGSARPADSGCGAIRCADLLPACRLPYRGHASSTGHYRSVPDPFALLQLFDSPSHPDWSPYKLLISGGYFGPDIATCCGAATTPCSQHSVFRDPAHCERWLSLDVFQIFGGE